MDQISLHALPKVTARGKKRVGRGYGSGKGGHTSGRGQKGQKSRRTIPWSFEGGALSLSHRLPFWRGKGRLHSLKPKPVIVNIERLERLKEGTVVDLSLLVKEGIVDQSQADARGVKILGDGKLTKKLTVLGLRMSGTARAAVEKVGGTVGEPQSPLASSRGLQPRSRSARLRGSGVPADFSKKENLGPSEKKKVERAAQVEPVEKAAERRVKKQTKTKKRVVKSSRRVSKAKTTPKKKVSKGSKTT